jgi:hypothetical protein
MKTLLTVATVATLGFAPLPAVPASVPVALEQPAVSQTRETRHQREERLRATQRSQERLARETRRQREERLRMAARRTTDLT